jgi:hypothetical protein
MNKIMWKRKNGWQRPRRPIKIGSMLPIQLKTVEKLSIIRQFSRSSAGALVFYQGKFSLGHSEPLGYPHIQDYSHPVQYTCTAVFASRLVGTSQTGHLPTTPRPCGPLDLNT